METPPTEPVSNQSLEHAHAYRLCPKTWDTWTRRPSGQEKT